MHCKIFEKYLIGFYGAPENRRNRISLRHLLTFSTFCEHLVFDGRFAYKPAAARAASDNERPVCDLRSLHCPRVSRRPARIQPGGGGVPAGGLDGGNPIGPPSAVTSPRTCARGYVKRPRVRRFPAGFPARCHGRRGCDGNDPRAQPDVSRKRHTGPEVFHVWIARAPPPLPPDPKRVLINSLKRRIGLPERREHEENIRFERRSDQPETFFRPNLIKTPSMKKKKGMLFRLSYLR